RHAEEAWAGDLKHGTRAGGAARLRARRDVPLRAAAPVIRVPGGEDGVAALGQVNAPAALVVVPPLAAQHARRVRRGGRDERSEDLAGDAVVDGREAHQRRSVVDLEVARTADLHVDARP